MAEKIFGVIWDCGGVIINFDASITDCLLAADCGNTTDRVNAFLYGSSAQGREYNAGAIEDYYLGRCDSAAFYETVKNGLGLKMSQDDFEQAWNATITQPNVGIVQLIHKLQRASFQQGVLSSTNPWHWDRMNQRSAIEGHVSLQDLLGQQRIVTSYGVGHKKPSPELFVAACNALGLPKEKCVYVDDIKKYTNAALEWGMGAAVHVDIAKSYFVEQCIDDLANLGFY